MKFMQNLIIYPFSNSNYVLNRRMVDKISRVIDKGGCLRENGFYVDHVKGQYLRLGGPDECISDLAKIGDEKTSNMNVLMPRVATCLYDLNNDDETAEAITILVWHTNPEACLDQLENDKRCLGLENCYDNGRVKKKIA